MKLKKILKKTLAYTLSAGMSISMFSGLTLGTLVGIAEENKSAYATWDNETECDIEWYDSNANEYHIDTAYELGGLSKLVNDGVDDFANKIVYIDDNIDLGASMWTPIGNEEHSFSGTFDGQGYEISNMCIDVSRCDYYDGAGLFGYVNKGKTYRATIKNIGVVNCEINASEYAAPIAGTINNTCVYNCYATGSIEGEYYVSGFIGYTYESDIINCYSNVYVGSNSTNTEVSGVYGGMFAWLSQSYAANCYYGGKLGDINSYGIFVGSDDASKIVHSYYNDAVNEEEKYSFGIGGYFSKEGNPTGIFNGNRVDNNEELPETSEQIVTMETFCNELNQESYLIEGRLINSSEIEELKSFVLADGVNNGWPAFATKKATPITLTASEESGNVYWSKTVEFDVAYNDSATYSINGGEEKTFSGSLYLNVCENLEAGQSEAIRIKVSGKGYSIDKTFTYTMAEYGNWTDDGNYDISWYDKNVDEYFISTPEQLAGVAALANGIVESIGIVSFDEKTIYITDDISLEGNYWNPIGNENHPFMGNFNGNNHIISMMSIQEETEPDINDNNFMDYRGVGFFGAINGYNQYERNEQTVDGPTVEQVNGVEISNINIYADYVEGYSAVGILAGRVNYAMIYNCSVTGSVTGHEYTGALVGYLISSETVNCSAKASVTSVGESDEISIGGFVGVAATNSYVVSCIYSGYVSAKSKGLFAGSVNSSSVLNCYVDDLILNEEEAKNEYIAFLYAAGCSDVKGISTFADGENDVYQNMINAINDYDRQLFMPERVEVKVNDFILYDEDDEKYYWIGFDTTEKALGVVVNISTDYSYVGNQVAINSFAYGGKNGYTYRYSVKNLDTNQLFYLTDFTSESEFTWTAGSAGNREFYVEVKDAEGTIVKSKEKAVLVENPLSINADISAASIFTGESVKLSAKGSYGYGVYKYSYLVHNLDNETWFRLTDFVEEDSYIWTAGSAGNREFFVEVRDENNNIARSNALKVNVSDSDEFMVKGSVTCNLTKVGDKVTITGTALGAKGNTTYSFLVHNLDNGSWYRMSGFTGNRSIEWTAGSAGNREFFVEAKDAGGQVVRSSAINVKTAADGELCVAGEASADRIKVGDEITIKANTYGGDEAYTYSYLVHNTENNTWYRMSGFTANDSITWRAGSTGNREFFVEVKDGNEDVVRSAAVNVAVK